jgi:adenine-specific DNA methylase
MEANQAVFNNNCECKSMNCNALDLAKTNFDLVYIDTPYISNKGSSTDYLDFYHFLEGLCNYSEWEQLINRNYKHLPIKENKKSPWNDKTLIYQEFDKLFCKFQKSKLVVSYREDGIPSIDELSYLMGKYKNNVENIHKTNYKYALSHNSTKEILLIGT